MNGRQEERAFSHNHCLRRGGGKAQINTKLQKQPGFVATVGKQEMRMSLACCWTRLKRGCPGFQVKVGRPGMLHPWKHLLSTSQSKLEQKPKCSPGEILTNNSFGVFLTSGSLNKHASTNSTAAFGNLPSGVSLGAGSLTICCSNSRILIVLAPP